MHHCTASNDGTARLWDIDLDATRQYVAGRLLRDLNQLERAQYAIEDVSTAPKPV
jgi:hypothetical protein